MQKNEYAFYALSAIKQSIPDFPELDLTHIDRLTNQVGILQHAKFNIPDYRHGYCVDDNSRALIVAIMAYSLQPHDHYRKLIDTYVSYIYYMQREDGQFRNFLSFDHRFLDDAGTEDSFGRTVWSIGVLLRDDTFYEYHSIAREMFDRAKPHLLNLRSLRAVGYCLLGMIYYLDTYNDDHKVRKMVEQLADYMVDEFSQNADEGWLWFEKIISYDNAILPLSLLRAGKVLDNGPLQDLGIKTAEFLDTILFKEDTLSIIGNEGWYTEGGDKTQYGQQAIEVPSLILLYRQLFDLTGDPHYKKRMIDAMAWFFGRNDRELSLYDTVTKGCGDGLERHGVNKNQGAESTICFWMAHLALCTLHV